MGKKLIILGANFSNNALAKEVRIDACNEDLWSSLRMTTNGNEYNYYGVLSPVKGNVIGVIVFGPASGAFNFAVNDGASATNKSIVGLQKESDSKEIIPLEISVPINQGDFFGIQSSVVGALRYEDNVASGVQTYSWKSNKGTIAEDNPGRGLSFGIIVDVL